MFPYPSNPNSGGPFSSPPYPQQPPYNMSGAQPQQQQQQQPPPPYGNPPAYGVGAGFAGGYQNNMPGPHGNNPYASNPNPQGGNPYAPGGYGMPGSNTGYPPSGYPPQQYQPPPSQPYGNNPYGANTSGYGSGYPPPPGPAGGMMPNDPRSQRLNQVIQRYEIHRDFAARLQALANCEIVVLCDDSGSMNTPLQGTNQTRWDELKSIVNIVIDIASTMDANGVDVYFLNRDPVMNVTNMQTMMHVFNSPPNGLTPLVPALRRILAAKRSQTFEKKLLILIATDGAPTNEYGQTDVGSLEAVLRHERTPQTYVTFLACTDDLDSVNYLSNWDRSMPNLDVIDDYRSERAEIQRNRGPTFPFSYGDYIVKALLGSMDPWFDSLDDRR